MAEPEPELEVLLRYVMDAQLPAEEPIMRWIAEPDADSLKLRAGDHALLVGGCEYLVDRRTGRVEVRDYRDPRAMRSQVYDPAHAGQPYLPPSVEERDPDVWSC